MSERKKETFDVTTEIQNPEGEGKVKKITEYAVLEPRPQDGREAQKVYNAAFAAALSSGGLLRQRVGTFMRQQGLWDDTKESEQQALVTSINEMELKIQTGGIKLTDARELAIALRGVRFELRELISKKNELDAATAEGQAENARFNALVSRCLVYNETGEPVYKDVDNYLENGSDEEAFMGAQTLANMMFQLDKNHEAGLPENKFLKKWRFVDEELRLINKNQRLVDTEGRLINDEGHYVDEAGTLVDIKGNPVDAEGNYVVEASPFLDDDGNPLSDPDAEIQAPPVQQLEAAAVPQPQPVAAAPVAPAQPQAQPAVAAVPQPQPAG